MAENEVNTITISLDEYFDLRTRAEANTYLTRELGRLEARFETLQNNFWELEQRVREKK